METMSAQLAGLPSGNRRRICDSAALVCLVDRSVSAVCLADLQFTWSLSRGTADLTTRCRHRPLCKVIPLVLHYLRALGRAHLEPLIADGRGDYCFGPSGPEGRVRRRRVTTLPYTELEAWPRRALHLVCYRRLACCRAKTETPATSSSLRGIRGRPRPNVSLDKATPIQFGLRECGECFPGFNARVEPPRGGSRSAQQAQTPAADAWACLSSDRALSVALVPEARYKQSNHGGGKQTAAATEQNLGTA
jgi:hypothetical protein